MFVFLSCLKVLEEREPRWKNPNIYKKNFPLAVEKINPIKMILCIRRQLDFELLAKGFKVLQSVALVNGTSISVENKIRKYFLFYYK